MTNGEKYRNPDDRGKAFNAYCNKQECSKCELNKTNKRQKSFCFFYWLDLEYKDELKPCPFCGCEKISTLVLHGDERRLRCTECGAQTSVFIDKKDMIDSWNRRV